MKCYKLLLALLLGITIGCRAEVKTTDDATKLEVEVPKLEVGGAPVDADPNTDADIDVDTPAPGDK